MNGRCGTSSLLRDFRGIPRLVMIENLGKAPIQIGELHGLLSGLIGAERENLFPLEAFGDSKIAIGSFNNQKIPTPLDYMWEKMRSRISEDGITVEHKSRRFNTAADRLAQEAIDLTKGHKVERAYDLSSKLIEDCWKDKYGPSKIIDTKEKSMPLVMELSDDSKFRKWLDTGFYPEGKPPAVVIFQDLESTNYAASEDIDTACETLQRLFSVASLAPKGIDELCSGRLERMIIKSSKTLDGPEFENLTIKITPTSKGSPDSTEAECSKMICMMIDFLKHLEDLPKKRIISIELHGKEDSAVNTFMDPGLQHPEDGLYEKVKYRTFKADTREDLLPEIKSWLLARESDSFTMLDLLRARTGKILELAWIEGTQLERSVRRSTMPYYDERAKDDFAAKDYHFFRVQEPILSEVQ
ncbi:hypothetical protein RJ639_045183 [Escallonia herrerae]|uniref:RNase H type-1 domain-containing protein n=1 Tax=Escallonia herrerae TaxID=1293975 RepID=A0AA89B2A5_9ASTE|nr:hypothetical protein RJ639_045183 [Escallonia herrerae]